MHNKPTFGSLIETHVQQPKCKKFINSTLPGWSYENNYEFFELGKIWVLWHPSVRASVLSKSLQMLTCVVKFPIVQTEFVVSFVYAANEVIPRCALWSELSNLAADQALIDKPWAVLDDFNQVLNCRKHSQALDFPINRGMRDFKDCLLSAHLADLTFKGSSYPWWNHNYSNPIAKKLDRVFVNEDWLNLFPSSIAYFGEPDFSDHSPAGIILNLSRQHRKTPFKFQNMLLQNEEFIPLILSYWNSLHFTSTAMFCVS